MKWLKFAAPGVNEKTEKTSPDLRYIGLEDVESWTGRLLDGEDYSPESTSNLFKAGDVLFGKLRPYLAKIFQASKEGVCSSEFFVLRPKSVKSDFLKYYLLTQEFVGLVNSSTFGAKMPRASWEFMGHLPLVIPPEEEQRKIAQFLDYQTAKIDRLIEKQQRLIDLLEEKRLSVISETVRKGLNSDAPMHDSGLPWLGEIPSHWSAIKLGYVAKLQAGFAFKTEWFDDEGIPVIRMANLDNGKINLQNVKKVPEYYQMENFSIKNGDILFGMSGSIGNFAVVSESDLPLQLNQRVGRFWGFGSNLKRCFLESLVQSKLFLDQIWIKANGTAQFNISSEQVESVYIPLPPLIEQENICERIHEEVQKIEQLKEKSIKSMALLREHRGTLISAAVTGKIDVRGWQPPETEPEEFDTTEALNG
jgi:type I restriction enzyme S subunit